MTNINVADFFYGDGQYCYYEASVVSLTCTLCPLCSIGQQAVTVQCSFV